MRNTEQEAKDRQVVRLTTYCFYDKKKSALHIRRSLTTLRRKSSGYQLIEEECSATGADDTVKIITNLSECKDGIYVVVTCNEKRDYETGYIDSYDFKLIPFEEPTQ